MDPTGALLFFNLKQTLKSLSLSEGGIDAKQSFCSHQRGVTFLFQFGEFIFFFFSIICIGVQLIYRVVLFMILDACIPILAYS